MTDMRGAALLVIATLAGQAILGAQTARRPAATRPAQGATRTEAAQLSCPMVLGQGVETKRTFCDVPIGRDPSGGILISLPPHTGPVTLTFDLHNRHTYSEEQVKQNRAYHRYTASIGVLTMDNTLLSRAAIENEFRTAADLVDRIAAGVGTSGLKAVAPTGSESVTITIPAEEQSVSILGEKLSVLRVDGVDNFIASGRPIAVVSNVTITYRPGPARRAPARR